MLLQLFTSNAKIELIKNRQLCQFNFVPLISNSALNNPTHFERRKFKDKNLIFI